MANNTRILPRIMLTLVIVPFCWLKIIAQGLYFARSNFQHLAGTEPAKASEIRSIISRTTLNIAASRDMLDEVYLLLSMSMIVRMDAIKRNNLDDIERAEQMIKKQHENAARINAMIKEALLLRETLWQEFLEQKNHGA